MADTGKWQQRNTYAGFSRYLCASNAETVWVLQRHNPNDARSTAPVPRFKITKSEDALVPPAHWVPIGEPPLRTLSRACEEPRGGVGSSQATRDENWSTLRQMLPSKGWVSANVPPRWGTGWSTGPSWSTRRKKRFPHINSSMTNYVDEMHLTNRLTSFQPTPI